MKLHLGYEWHIFHIFTSKVKILLMSFFCFSFGLNIWSLSSHGKKCFTHLLRSLVKYFFHSKINFICSRHCVISSTTFKVLVFHIIICNVLVIVCYTEVSILKVQCFLDESSNSSLKSFALKSRLKPWSCFWKGSTSCDRIYWSQGLVLSSHQL